MQFVLKCILFPIFILICVIFLVIVHFTIFENLTPALMNAYNASDKGTPQGNAFKAPSIFNSLEIIAWAILGIFAFVGIADIIVSSQADEYEPYEYQRRY